MSHPESAALKAAPVPLTRRDRYVILICAFLGWFCAGFHMSITSLAMRPAAIDLLAARGDLDQQEFTRMNGLAPRAGLPSMLSEEEAVRFRGWNALVTSWYGWYQCAFLLGAATGGLLFGRLGDRWGRAYAMSMSILTYSALSGVASLAQDPWQLLVIWFLACTGVGGMWPNGVALVSEAWSDVSRPLIAGVIGTSANIGIFLFATLAGLRPITPDDWRWTMWVGAAPLVLGLISLIAVPESRHWLADRLSSEGTPGKRPSTWIVFQGPLRNVTLVGILLATIPLIGAYGSANWMVPWADQVGSRSDPPRPELKANVQQARAFTGLVGSLIGGWVGSLLGRRLAYFLTSLCALLISQYAFWYVVPTDSDFLIWVAALGFFSGIYFGWLPLFLPELFPTSVRSTGNGVSFNFGRILTAVTVLTTATVVQFFHNNYAQIGRVTSLIFALGMIAIFLAPDTTQKNLAE